ncbi:unnamed protein product [Schistosoma margrebowiei]|uniref:Uncharacterized protein n=1 Tax=Schistosoma margrebowiei TaxID=48269 RepID=A0AA85AH10_9TREM|nr:unnamed protein product [Schistosoma margrebowiei]
MKFMNIITILFLFGIFISIHGYPDYRDEYSNEQLQQPGFFSNLFKSFKFFCSISTFLGWFFS